MQGYATSEPEIRAHVRAGFGELVRDVSPRWRVSPPRRPGTSSPTGCCSTSTAALDFPREAWAVIFRHRRAIAWGALVLVAGRGGVRAAGVRRARQRERLRRPVAPRRSRPATPSTAARARSRRRASSRWCGWTRRPSARRRAQRIARVRGGAARPGRGVGGRLRAGRRPRGWSPRDGRSTYLLATFKNDPAGARTRIEERLARRAVGDARRRRDRRARGRRPGLGRHRARRADRVPDPLPADAARLPQRGLGAAAAGGRRLDDPAQLPRDPGRQPTSTRCRSTP